MKKLPIGIHSFSEIIGDDYLYIDKTKEAYELLSAYKYVFLSRPRRFGKSLFLTTLQAIFEGKKELFKGLYIYDKYDFEPYPVIRIHWGGNFTSEFNFQSEVQSTLRWNAECLDVTFDKMLALSAQFDLLIKETYKKVAFYRGLELFNELQYNEALKYLQKAIGGNSALAARATYWAGETAYQLKDYKGAESYFTQFLHDLILLDDLKTLKQAHRNCGLRQYVHCVCIAECSQRHRVGCRG